MSDLLQNTAHNVMVLMVDSTNHVAGVPGLTLAITASKDGGAFAAITPTVADRGNGWYSLALTTGHTDTLGDLVLHVTGTGADPTDIKFRVIVAPLLNTTWTDARAAALDFLDVPVSSRSVYAGGPVASVTAPVTVAGGSGGPTVPEIVDGILSATFDAALHTRDQAGVADPTVADAMYGAWVVAFGIDEAAVRTFVRRGATGQPVRSFALEANVNSQSRT